MADDFPPGTMVDEFEVGDELGRGDYGRVYRAVARDGTVVALKIMYVSTGDPAIRFDNEKTALRALEALDHPGIPKVVDEGLVDGKPYFAMTLAPGRTLQSRILENIETNSRFSDLQTLIVAREVLDVLTRMHELPMGDAVGLVHRDIKDANILVTDSLERVSLVDYGFCKEDHATDRRLADSIFRAGAMRYSPPAKLKNPATAIANHDVFAVGVLMYYMLTNEFPWDIDTVDVGQQQDQIHFDPAVPVRDLNSTVRAEVSDFVANLLRIGDAYRPGSAVALEEASRLVDRLSLHGDTVQTYRAQRPLKFERVWRDPLYGDIRLTDYEMEVIDTAEMQRLRYLMQLGLTYLVYEGARHSRLSHSVGSLHRVEEILTSVERIEGVRVDHETRLSARLFALVHDVTHIPIGHTLEDEYGLFFRHDENSSRINRLVLDAKRSTLANKLSETEWGREVRKQFDPDATVHRKSDVGELVQGPVGADLLDYIDRDAYFCGLDHHVDSAIVRQLRIVPGRATTARHVVSLSRGTYGVRTDREFALETLYSERYAMFLKVYTHKAKIKASALVSKALSISMMAGKKPALTEAEIEWLGDESLLLAIATRRRQNERESVLIRKLHTRHLPKAVYRASLLRPEERNQRRYEDRQAELADDSSPLWLFPASRRLEVEDDLARSSRLHRDQVFVYVPFAAPGYKKTQRHRFMVDDSGATSAPANEWFDRLKAKHLGLWDLWVFADADADEDGATRLGHAAQEHFGLENLVQLPVRQGLLF